MPPPDYISAVALVGGIYMASCFCRLAATTPPTFVLGNHTVISLFSFSPGLIKQQAVKAQLSVQWTIINITSSCRVCNGLIEDIIKVCIGSEQTRFYKQR